MAIHSSARSALRRAFTDGAPVWVIALVVLTGTVALLLTAASKEHPVVRGYAEFVADPPHCDLRHTLNAIRCVSVGDDVYRITFTKDVSRSAPVATRGTCCPGVISVSVASRRAVVLRLWAPVSYPVAATVVVP